MLLDNLEHVNCCVCNSNSSEIISNGVDFEYNTVTNNFSFHRCNICGHNYLNPRPSSSDLGKIYPSNYGNYSNSKKFSVTFFVKGILESLFLKKLFNIGNKPESVLDVGCGDGRLLKIIQSTVRHDCILEGVEISDTASTGAKKLGFQVYNGSVEKIELKPDFYDYIFLIQVIEHLHDPIKSIAKLRGSLKKGGILVIETPDTDCLDYKIFFNRYWGGFHYPRHFNLFNKKNLSTILSADKFEMILISNKLQPVHWLWSVHHFLKEKFGNNILTKSFNIKNILWITFFTVIDSIQLFFLKKSSNQRIVCKKKFD